MNPYLSHLVDVNEIQPVFARIDIFDTSGNLLIKQGEMINKDSPLLDFDGPLPISIEEATELEDQFTATQIYEVLNALILSDDSFKSIYRHSPLDEEFIACIEYFCQHHTLRQKLNVLAIQIPDVFDQALFCAWLSVTVLAHEKRSQDELNHAFMAALCHDFGFLHIAPEILFKEGPLEPQEWLTIQNHPLIGRDILARVSGISEYVLTAVYEHHENFDGTGYPHGKTESELGELGVLLHLLDSVNAIYRKHFKPRQRSLNDLIPLMQMNTLSRYGNSARVLISLFKETPSTQHCTFPENLISELVQYVQSSCNRITDFVSNTKAFSQLIKNKNAEGKIKSLQHLAKNIEVTMNRCGLINDAYMRWLDQVEKEKLTFAYRELEDVLLMTQEIIFHIETYRRNIDAYIIQHEDSSIAKYVRELNKRLTPESKNCSGTALDLFLSGK